MRTISHSELRNQSAQVLRQVAAGESMLVTNRGQVVAQIGPPDVPATSLPRVLSAANPVRRFPTRVERSQPSQAMIDAVRGEA